MKHVTPRSRAIAVVFREREGDVLTGLRNALIPCALFWAAVLYWLT